MTTKVRLDQMLVERGLAESRERAQRLIRAGLVLIGTERLDKPGRLVASDAEPVVQGSACPYVSRGGLKLEGALRRFGMLRDGATPPGLLAPSDGPLAGVMALDVGASTGGFTDCLLQQGAAHVWAIDVGRAQLHERMRKDPRVTSREQVNARALAPDGAGAEAGSDKADLQKKAGSKHAAHPLCAHAIDIAVIDVSFISLRLILPPLPLLLAPGASVVALVKPQFEASKKAVGRRGVVRERATHEAVLRGMAEFVVGSGWELLGVCPSPLRGPAGNAEFFFWLRRREDAGETHALPGAASPALAARPLAGDGLENAIVSALDEIYTDDSILGPEA